MTLIHSEFFDTKSALPVLSGIAGDWRKIRVRGSITFSTAGATLLLQPSCDGGASWITTGVKTHLDQQAQPSSPNNRSVDAVFAGLVSVGAAMVGKQADFEYDIFNPNHGGADKTWSGLGQGTKSDGNFYSNDLNGVFPAQMINALRLTCTSGNMSGWVEVTGERETDAFPANDVFRVACTGASLTYSGGWLFPVQSQLQVAWPTKRVVMRNFGNPGIAGRSSTALLNIGNLIASDPDVVILDHSAADSAYSTLTASYAQTIQLIDQLEAAGITVKLLITNPMTGGNFPNLTSFYQQYRTIGALKGCEVIDCFPLWQSLGSFATVGNDGVHPTPAANALVTVPAVYNALLT